MPRHIVALHRLEPYSPFHHPVWMGMREPISYAEVAKALRENRLKEEPVGAEGSRQEHIERVAYLVLFLDPTPLQVDVGVPQLGHCVSWPLLDGHHRLAAAFYRNDPAIEISGSGSDDLLESLFPRADEKGFE